MPELYSLIGLALLALGAAGALLHALLFAESVRKKALNASKVALALFFVAIALFGAFAYSYSETTSFTQASVELAGNELAGNNSVLANKAEYKTIETKTETFTKQVSPVECEGVRDIVYWRELRVYNGTVTDAKGVNKTVSFTRFTLTIENNGTQRVSNVLITEHIPSIVAAESGQVFNFTLAPASVRKGSVVVEWMFDNVEPGEKKSVSYTVEKKVGAQALNDFDAPNVVAKAVKQGQAGEVQSAAGESIVEVSAQRAGVDWMLPGLVAVTALVGAIVYYFARKTRQPPAA